jgi:ABC-type sugar transport system substrate-binding protein
MKQHKLRRRARTLIAVCSVAIGLFAAYGAAASFGASSGGSLAALQKEPTKIASGKLGAFKPKPHGFIYGISCDESVVACSVISNGVGAGAKAIGYKYKNCNAGSTPNGGNTCFTDAVNAKPSAIVINGTGNAQAGAGYAAAKKAGIPVVGIFTGNPTNKSVSAAEIGGTGCVVQAQELAEGLLASSKKPKDTIYLDTNLGCAPQRWSGFSSAYHKGCPKCKLTKLEFDDSTLNTTLPQQVQSALQRDPSVNWVVATQDPAAGAAATVIDQLGKQSDVSVEGFDSQPSNVVQVEQGGVQKFDVSFPLASAGWAGVDAAARIYSGRKVPGNIPSNVLLVTKANAHILGSTHTWAGEPNYQGQYRKLWKMGS